MKKLIILSTLVLAGCGAYADTNGINVSGADGIASVQEITLKDGTRCAVLVGYQKGAISCDWNGSK